jgi:hypothetical protein
VRDRAEQGQIPDTLLLKRRLMGAQGLDNLGSGQNVMLVHG